MNPTTAFPWPEGFERVPEEEWRHHPIDQIAIRYDAVEHQGWYRNLQPTLDQLGTFLREGDVVLDYSAGTGILARRLLRSDINCAVLLVDASPKFLRLALERLGDDPRAAFRLIRYLEPERRLQLVQEVTDAEVLAPGVDAVVSTNAIHLYYDLDITLNSWAAALKPGGLAFVQSGNVRNPEADRDHWIIDDTVEAIHRAAVKIVREDPRYAAYRGHLDDAPRQRKYDQLREKFFLPPVTCLTTPRPWRNPASPFRRWTTLPSKSRCRNGTNSSARITKECWAGLAAPPASTVTSPPNRPSPTVSA